MLADLICSLQKVLWDGAAPASPKQDSLNDAFLPYAVGFPIKFTDAKLSPLKHVPGRDCGRIVGVGHGVSSLGGRAGSGRGAPPPGGGLSLQ